LSDLPPIELPAPTERLLFRSWHEDDLALASGLWGDPAVTAMISREPLDEAAVRARLAAELGCEREHGVQYWPIFFRFSGEHVGCCGLRPYDLPKRIYEIGFHVRAAFWGQGLAGEAARSVVGFAFERLDASALFAGHHPQNTGSRRVLEKLAFQHTHDEHYPPTGLRHPSYLLFRPG
jgi:RimJ/RimL family protein N-acetyltransferase